jgi:predicted nucleic acid-binding protein
MVVDASVWIDYLREKGTAQTEWLDGSFSTQPLGLTDITLCEVLQGIRDRNTATRIQRYLLSFQVLSTGGPELAVAAAENYRSLRERGITIRKTVDCWVASFCLLRGYWLLHNDRDFQPFAQHLGLKIVSLS